MLGSKTSKLMIVSSLSVILLVGCGGSGGSSDSDNNSGASITGKVIDDYIQNAPVKTLSGISCGITDSSGAFSCPVEANDSPLVADCSSSNSSCIDVATKQKFSANLLAPKASKVITPITNLLQIAISKGEIPEKAEEEIKKSLGIADITTSLTEYDPVKNLESNDNAQKDIAQKVFAAQTKVMAVLLVTTKTQPDVSFEKASEILVEKLLQANEETSFEEIAKEIVKTDKIEDILEKINTAVDRETAGAILKVVTEENNIDQIVNQLEEKIDEIKQEVANNLNDTTDDATSDDNDTTDDATSGDNDTTDDATSGDNNTTDDATSGDNDTTDDATSGDNNTTDDATSGDNDTTDDTTSSDNEATIDDTADNDTGSTDSTATGTGTGTGSATDVHAE